MRKLFVTVWMFLWLVPVSADFPTCAPNVPKKPLDDFCPKIEGQPLERCCPVKTVKVRCTFHRESSESYSYTSSGGGCPAQPCCAMGSRQCQTEVSSGDQDLPVIYRGSGCCVAPCQEPAGGGWIPGEIEACGGGGSGGSCDGETSCSSIPNNCPPGIINPPPPPPEEPPGQPPQPPAPPVPGGNG